MAEAGGYYNGGRRLGGLYGCQPMSRPSYVHLAIRLPAPLKRALERQAAVEQKHVSELVREFLHEGISKCQRKSECERTPSSLPELIDQ